MKQAIAFLCNKPKGGTINFATKLAGDINADIYLIVDDNTYEGCEYEGINIIQVEDNYCIKKGYWNMMTKDSVLSKTPIAWDKFVFFFSECVNYDFVWVFEDDVFIPSTNAIINLIVKYSGYDLVTPNHFERVGNAMDWHWKHVEIGRPHYYSMVCAMGISNNMINCVREYARKNKKLFFNEIMFNTLAAHDGLSVVAPFELKSIVWQGHWGIDEFLLLPNNVFHPMKEIDLHESYRTMIMEKKKNNYVPKNNLPDFLCKR